MYKPFTIVGNIDKSLILNNEYVSANKIVHNKKCILKFLKATQVTVTKWFPYISISHICRYMVFLQHQRIRKTSKTTF